MTNLTMVPPIGLFSKLMRPLWASINALQMASPKTQPIGWAEFRYSIKFIEDPAEVFRRNTDAPIGNQNLELVIDDAAPDLDRLVGRRILESVAKQVDEYMGNQSKVHGNKRQVLGMSKETCR